MAALASFTQELAAYASTVRYADLPAAVPRKIRQLLLDCLGNQIGAYGEEPAHLLWKVLGVADVAGPSTVVGYGSRTQPLLAGCVNGMLAHLIDMDDAHRDSLTKTGSAITPAVFALAQARRSNGKEVIEAAVAGYETMIRLGLAVNPAHRSRGFHSTATLGAFGAAAAAGRLLGFSSERMVDAFGIAGTQSAGLAAFIGNASMTKPLNVAKGVHSGMLAALLAHEGFRGPPDVLEGAEGFIHAYAGEADLAKARLGLGMDYRLLESGFKPHAACRYAHAPIDAAVRLMQEHGFCANAIETVDVHLSALAQRQSNFYEPGSVASAQGSTPFVIAAAIALAADSLTVDDVKRAYADPAVWALHRRVKLHADPDMDYMGRGCRLVVQLRDGRTCEARVELPRGEPEQPMSDEEIERKFMRQAQAKLGEGNASAIRDAMARLDMLDSIDPVMRATAEG
jgi:2-methylcitrate dehydratase PrpD